MVSGGRAKRDWKWFLAPLLTVSLAAGCGGIGDVFEPGQAQTVVLGVGEQAQTADGNLSILFVEVSDDSRCPTDVACVWAGNGQVVIQLEPMGASPVDEVLNTNQAVGPGEIVFRGYSFELVSLSPLPLSTIPIPPADYKAMLRITGESNQTP